MSNKYYYLRSVYSDELEGDFSERVRESGAVIPIPGMYKLGCSISLSPTLEGGDQVVEELLGDAGFTLQPDRQPSSAAKLAWLKASGINRSGARPTGFEIDPFRQAYIDDQNETLISSTGAGFLIAAAFQQDKAHFGSYDSGAGNSIRLQDLISRRTFDIV